MAQPTPGQFPATGVAVAVAAAISVATVSILLRQIGRTEATTTTVFWFTILSLPPLAIGMFFFGQAHDALTWGLLAIIGLAGGMGQLCLTGELRWAPVSVVLPMEYSSLIWETLFGWLIWDPWTGESTWAGADPHFGSRRNMAWREHARALKHAPKA